MRNMKTTCLLLLAILAGIQTLLAQQPNRLFVQFATGKWELSREAKARLDSLTDSLDLADKIGLHGFCDSRGSEAYNQQLSLRRVQAVRDYLLKNGWTSGDILIAKGHGENDPVAANNSAYNMQLNRRVEVRILHGKDTADLKEYSKPGGSITKQLTDSLVKPGDIITLKNLQFQGGRHFLLPESLPILDELLKAMTVRPALVIKVVGHICCVNGPEDGLDLDLMTTNLSLMRAKTVRDYLVQNGIAFNRVSYEGKGHAAPIHPFPEKSEEERIANRRVEIVILKR